MIFLKKACVHFSSWLWVKWQRRLSFIAIKVSNQFRRMTILSSDHEIKQRKTTLSPTRIVAVIHCLFINKTVIAITLQILIGHGSFNSLNIISFIMTIKPDCSFSNETEFKIDNKLNFVLWIFFKNYLQTAYLGSYNLGNNVHPPLNLLNAVLCKPLVVTIFVDISSSLRTW